MQGQDRRAASQLSRRNLQAPSKAENNLNTAELKITCLAQVCSGASSWLLSAWVGMASALTVSPLLQGLCLTVLCCRAFQCKKACADTEQTPTRAIICVVQKWRSGATP